MQEQSSQEIRQECDNCMLIGKCPGKCFDTHPGSIRALMKTFQNISVVDEVGNRFEHIEGGSGEYVRIIRKRIEKDSKC